MPGGAAADALGAGGALARDTRHAGLEALRGAAFHDGGVVRIGDDRAFRLRLVRGADHAEQRVGLVRCWPARTSSVRRR
ncbi:hypothetical protein G6F22_022006 [Rhizopus arrhizus]|nr:hypothetical protein G6F22_022006 [Rhizopus arrhizus]